MCWGRGGVIEAEEDMEGEREEGLEESSSSSPHYVFGAVVSWLTVAHWFCSAAEVTP